MSHASPPTNAVADNHPSHANERERVASSARARLTTAGVRFDVPWEPFVDRVCEVLSLACADAHDVHTLNLEDMYLAHACCNGDELALARFGERCDPELRAVVAKMRLSPSDFDDFRQQLWNKLFLGGPSGDKKALEYRGTGQINHWFRIVATRAMLDDRRRVKRSEIPSAPDERERLGPSSLGPDPELEYIRRQYRLVFRDVFDEALKALEPEERNLLRLHHVLGKTTEQIAVILGTHKATAARHVGKAREKLTKLTRKGLKSRLRANTLELESAMRLFDGELTCSWGNAEE